MPKIDPVPPEQAGWILKSANRYAKKRLGKELEPSAVLGHNSTVLAAYGVYEMASGRAKRVPTRIKTLASIKASMLVGCPF